MEKDLNGELNSYNIIEEEKSPYKKQLYWNMAIGLNLVDGLTPSEYLINLSDKNINGEISNKEVETLLNKYYLNKDVNDKKISNERECDLVSSRIVELINDRSFSFRTDTLKIIHEYLFKDIYEFAGKYRTYNISKDEPVLNNDTVVYASYNEIESILEYDFNKEKDCDYFSLDINDQIENLAKFTSSIWQVHPFGEGNTRTVAVMIEKYLRSIGYNINNDLFKNNSVYFRNALVRSNYSNRLKGIEATNEYLFKFFNNLLLDENNILNSSDLLIK